MSIGYLYDSIIEDDGYKTSRIGNKGIFILSLLIVSNVDLTFPAPYVVDTFDKRSVLQVSLNRRLKSE